MNIQSLHRWFAAVFIVIATLAPGLSRAGFGSALSFNGTGAYVSVPVLNMSGSNSMSIEAWVKPANFSNTYSEITRQQAPAMNSDWLLAFQNNGTILAFGLNTTNTGYQELHVTINPLSLADGNWHHIAATYDGTNKTLYIDGAVVGSTNQSGNLFFNGLSATIAAAPFPSGGSEFFNGIMDEVRIWNVPRSAAEINANMFTNLTGSETGLISYYRFDDGSGTTATDSSPNGHNGTLINGPVWVTSTVPNGPLPQAVTGPATNVTATSATLTGTGFPNGSATSVYFDYGTNTSYGVQSPLQGIGSSTGAVPVSASISSLSLATHYHYRLSAIGGGVTNHGLDQVFATLGPIDGTALSFNGTSSYVSAPAINLAGSQALTIEAWVKPVNITSTGYSEIVRQQTGGAFPDWILSFQTNGTVLAFGLETTVGPGYQEMHVTINPSNYTDGNWHHIAATYDGTNKYLYKDGILIGAAAQSGSVTYQGGANGIGASPVSGGLEWFDGLIDEVRLWGIARSSNDINGNMFSVLFGTDPGLAAYYRFDDGSGTSAADSSTNGRIATLVNSPSWVASTVPSAPGPFAVTGAASNFTTNTATLNGVAYSRALDTTVYFEYGTNAGYGFQTAPQHLGTFLEGMLVSSSISGLSSPGTYHWRLSAVGGGVTNHGSDQIFFTTGPIGGTALSFNGTNNSVDAPALNLSASNALSLEAWVKPSILTSTSESDIIRQQGPGFPPDWLLAFQGNGTILAFGLTTGGTYQEMHLPVNPGYYTDGNWHHLAAIYDGTKKLLYVDGIQVGTTSQSGNISFNGTVNVIGAAPLFGGSSNFFNGVIDEVRIWGIALTPVQILNNLFTTLEGTETGLAAYYRFDDGSGSSATDSSPNGHTATLVNGPAWVVSTVPGYLNPVPTTGFLSNFSTNSVSLSGTVFLRGSGATAWFDYGIDTNYGGQTTPQNLSPGTGLFFVSNSLVGLLAAQEYHCILLASNAGANFPGLDRVFFTFGTQGGDALSFNGSNSCVGLTPIDVGATNAITLEAWIQPANFTTSSNSEIMRQQASGSFPDWLLSFQNNGSIIAFGLKTAGTYQELHAAVNPSDYTDGGWHHIAATYDGTNKLLYSDGLQIASASQSGNINFTGTSNLIGAAPFPPGGSEFFNGLIDEVRVWNTPRSGAQLNEFLTRELTGAESGLVAYYRFDEGSGTNTGDLTGNGHGGILINNPAWVASTAPLIAAPAASTGYATNVSTFAATLTGMVNPAGFDMLAFFNYGPTTNYSSQTLAQDLGSGSTPVIATNPISGLSPGTQYHFQLVATNGLSTLIGKDRTFFTSGILGGYALNFNGSNSYVRLPIINFSGSNTLTLEAWIKPIDITTGNNSAILHQQAFSTTDWFLGFENHGVTLAFGIATGTGYQELQVAVNPADFTDGNWHHIAASYDGATQRLYADGSLIGSIAKSGNVTFTATQNSIGASFNGVSGSDFFNGEIDEVRIWSILRTASDLAFNLNRSLTGADAGLAAYYRFDEGSGSVANDATVNGRNGTLINAPAWLSSTAPLLPLQIMLTGFAPTMGMSGASVTINGTNLLAVSNVLFNGVSAVFSTNSNMSLTAIVPVSASTGPISLTNAYNNIVSTNTFLVDNTPPTVTFTKPVNASFIASLPAIIAQVTDNPGGSGVGSVFFYLQRESDFNFWTGSTWGAPTQLSASFINSLWSLTNSLPMGGNLANGAYTIFGVAADNVGNSVTTVIGITVDTSGGTTRLTLLPNGQAQIHFPGIPGKTYRVQASTDLSTWQDIGSVTVDSSGVLQFADPNTSGFPKRFYRTVTP